MRHIRQHVARTPVSLGLRGRLVVYTVMWQTLVCYNTHHFVNQYHGLAFESLALLLEALPSVLCVAGHLERIISRSQTAGLGCKGERRVDSSCTGSSRVIRRRKAILLIDF